MFKVGDRVKVLKNTHGGNSIGTIYTVSKIPNGFCATYENKNCIYSLENNLFNTEDELELITNNKTNMSIKEKFVLAFLGEPEKSFRKADITNGDGFLTTDGQSVFLAWLLKQNGVAFKKDVVDGILKDMEKDNK